MITIDATQIGGTANDTNIGNYSCCYPSYRYRRSRCLVQLLLSVQTIIRLTGSGSGATFTITTNGSGVPNVTVTHGGTGFAVDDTITIQGSKFSSAQMNLPILLSM